MGFLIYLNAEGKEVDRKQKGRGRPPKGAVKNEEDGNYYVSEGDIVKSKKITKKNKAKSKITVSKISPKDISNIALDNVRPKDKKKVDKEYKFSYEIWHKIFSHNTGVDENEDRIIFFNPYVTVEIFAGEINLLDSVFVWVEINKNTGDIAIWGNYLRKRAGEPQTDSEEKMEEYLADQKHYGDQDYILGPPTHILVDAVSKE